MEPLWTLTKNLQFVLLIKWFTTNDFKALLIIDAGKTSLISMNIL